MRHWNGWDAVNGLNQSKVTQYWCERLNTGQAKFNPNHSLKPIVVRVLEPTNKSQPSQTIHYTNNDRQEGMIWCEWPESIQNTPSWSET